jgi:hypothetical protein
MLLCDPASGAYAFSYIGYNGTMAGGGDTENSRWDDALKYRLSYGPVHFARVAAGRTIGEFIGEMQLKPGQTAAALIKATEVMILRV